jgi:hypothetical protein
MTSDDDSLMTFQRAIAEWRLGRKPIEEIPSAAVDALAGGVDTPTLARLAGIEGASWSEIRPVAERVAEELGGPPDEKEAKLLVADAWLARVANGSLDPAAYYDFSLTEEILWGLGGDYEWFRLAIYDLEILDAMEDHGERERAVSEIRERAAEVLRRSVAERLSAPAPTRDERPFLKLQPVKRRRLSRLLRRRSQ